MTLHLLLVLLTLLMVGGRLCRHIPGMINDRGRVLIYVIYNFSLRRRERREKASASLGDTILGLNAVSYFFNS